MEIFEDLIYSPSGQKLNLYLPQTDDAPLFLYFHGGGLRHGDKKKEGEILSDYLTKQGIAVASANYRLYPEAKYPDYLEDAADALLWIFQHRKEYGISDRIVVGGSSAGAYLSMMLCFDGSYLKKRGIPKEFVKGYVHDAGQPTCHFTYLAEERGVDSRRVIVDPTSALYHVGEEETYPPMLFLVSDQDMKGRPEQTDLMIATLRHFGHEKVYKQLMHGTHCKYVCQKDEHGDSILGKIVCEFYREKLEPDL